MTGRLYAGGYATSGSCFIDGDVLVTFTGSDLLMASVDGGSSVSGTRTLCLSDFTGEFNTSISNFDRVCLSGDTMISSMTGSCSVSTMAFDLTDRSTPQAMLSSDCGFSWGDGQNLLEIQIDPDQLTASTSFDLMAIEEEPDNLTIHLLDADGAQMATLTEGMPWTFGGKSYTAAFDDGYLTFACIV